MQDQVSRAGGTAMKTMTGWVGLMTLAVGLLIPAAWAAEPVKISSLQTYPDAYKMKVIQVEGTVNSYRMDHFIGNNTKLEKCIQNFMVDDGTGMIQASYTALCGMGPVMLQDGDQVIIEGHYLGTLDVRAVRKH